MKSPMPNKLPSSPPMKESELVRLCLDWLRAEKILAWRNNTGAVAASYNGKKRFVRFGEPGLPDIIAVNSVVQPWTWGGGGPYFAWGGGGPYFAWGQFWAIECKTGRGIQSPAQVDFQNRLESAGGRYLLVRSLEDLRKGLGR